MLSTFVLSSTADAGPGTLRDALTVAASGDTIDATGLSGVIALSSGQLAINTGVTILGPGPVVKRPVVIDDPNLGETIAVRQMVYLALTYDHRIVDGADAARFLVTIKERLEAGAFERALGLV